MRLALLALGLLGLNRFGLDFGLRNNGLDRFGNDGLSFCGLAFKKPRVHPLAEVANLD
ncbi:MAG: hypothetical protein ACOYOL_07185 [Chthoniobacterales bacterium]